MIRAGVTGMQVAAESRDSAAFFLALNERAGAEQNTWSVRRQSFSHHNGDLSHRRRWGIPGSPARADRHLHRTVGVNLFDKANMYSLGRSEEILGVGSKRNDVLISSKARRDAFPSRHRHSCRRRPERTAVQGQRSRGRAETHGARDKAAERREPTAVHLSLLASA